MDQEKDLTQVIEPVENMMKRLNVNTVFGEPIKEGDQTVIPVASVSYAFGFGAGYGSGQSPDQEEGQPANVGEGGGSGAGAMGRAKPVGVLRITAEGAHFEPAMDPKMIALAGIAMIAWNVFWIAATVRAFARR
jgi:uncharacterized spore protein YtfJ